MRLEIDSVRLGLLFPAHIIVGRDLAVTSCGPSLARQLPNLAAGEPLLDHFWWTGGGGPDEIGRLAADGQVIQLSSRREQIRLTGSALQCDSGYLLALRIVPSEFVLGADNLQISDFSPDDPLVAGLMLVGLQRAMIEESQTVALELARERQRSVSLLDRISRISGFMAHDFNNFLSIIRLNCDRLLREKGQDRRVQRLASIIRETATRGSAITRSLMTLSRQRDDSRMPIVIDDLIRENLSFFQTIVGSKVEVVVRLGAGARSVEVSQVGILNSLTNLLINGRDAMPDGGTIAISTGLRTVALELSGSSPKTAPREFLAIEVSDTGSGMTDSILSRAFEPLFSTKSHGNGIGLASVLEFAREMGGDACLDSEPGEGARIYIYLPTADGNVPFIARRSVEEAASAGRSGSRNLSVLLVEDEPYALEALTEMIEAEGYSVFPCSSVAEALEVLGRESCQLLLTDIIMPGESGAELARKACSMIPTLKVILMSGYVPDMEELHADWMFIRKPMDTKNLLDMIYAALSGSITR